ncbi:MAG: phosphoribosylformylglycinamidine synthase subunit PurQ [Oligoflexia bacterium]|nr:phosphoribosylformylglycinamidine synthase subunit PurQ [Oligoflexia bacterium]
MNNSKKDISILIISGQGINCDQEMFHAYKLLGVNHIDVIHINTILNNPTIIHNYDLINFPGGFSFGDNLSSGKVLANLIKYKKVNGKKYSLLDQIKIFIENAGYILGVCNGFQILVHLNLLTNTNSKLEFEVTLKENKTNKFENRWCKFIINKQNKTPFFRGIDFIELPIRCGEGRVVIRDLLIREEILSKNLHILQYIDQENNLTDNCELNPCGSDLYLAALTDLSGQILGMMPHPEAYLTIYNHPNWPTKKTQQTQSIIGLNIFQNIVQHISEVKYDKHIKFN